jgi:hypothetical protein
MLYYAKQDTVFLWINRFGGHKKWFFLEKKYALKEALR